MIQKQNHAEAGGHTTFFTTNKWEVIIDLVCSSQHHFSLLPFSLSHTHNHLQDASWLQVSDPSFYSKYCSVDCPCLVKHESNYKHRDVASLLLPSNHQTQHLGCPIPRMSIKRVRSRRLDWKTRDRSITRGPRDTRIMAPQYHHRFPPPIN